MQEMYKKLIMQKDAQIEELNRHIRQLHAYKTDYIRQLECEVQLLYLYAQKVSKIFCNLEYGTIPMHMKYNFSKIALENDYDEYIIRKDLVFHLKNVLKKVDKFMSECNTTRRPQSASVNYSKYRKLPMTNLNRPNTKLKSRPKSANM